MRKQLGDRDPECYGSSKGTRKLNIFLQLPQDIRDSTLFDTLVVDGTFVSDPEDIKGNHQFYQNLYKETEYWRPDYNL